MIKQIAYLLCAVFKTKRKKRFYNFTKAKKLFQDAKSKFDKFAIIIA